MNRLLIHLITFVFLFIITSPLAINPYSGGAGKFLIEPASIQMTNKEISSLKEEIIKNKVSFEEPAQNAWIDKVWKKTPGRNGLKVNVEKSLKKMQEKGKFDPSLLVLEQVPPAVTLADLPAAPIYRGHPDKNMVALLINVAWGTENIPSMLHTLKKAGVKATFFIEGKWASNHSDLVKMIEEEGHLIGNHAYNHPDMSRLNFAENKEQITQTNEILAAITGDKPKWFAPPSGSFNNEVVQIANELDMETILWSVDTVDWKKPTVSVMVQRVTEKLHPGAMILMHPTDVIEEGLEELILKIKEKKYRIGTVEKLLSEQR